MVRKNYSEEQEKMARFAKAMGHPYGAGTKRRTETFRIRTFLKNFPIRIFYVTMNA